MNQPTERSTAEVVIERRRAPWPLIIGAFAVRLAVIVIGRSVGGGGRSTSPSSSTLPPTTAAAATSSGPEPFETSTTVSPTTIGSQPVVVGDGVPLLGELTGQVAWLSADSSDIGQGGSSGRP